MQSANVLRREVVDLYPEDSSMPIEDFTERDRLYLEDSQSRLGAYRYARGVGEVALRVPEYMPPQYSHAGHGYLGPEQYIG